MENRSNFVVHRYRPLLIGIGALVILGMLTYWGGSPSPGPGFVLGVAALTGSIFLFAGLIWWFLISPLPPREQVRVSFGSPSFRQTLAVLIAIGALNFVVGAFWDEVWHRVYGLPFGEDFFWRPHIMMYLSLGLTAVFALGGLWFIINKNPGSLRQRFRAQPLIGLLVLISGFQTITTPFDPLWHQVYGEDLSAWSLPHTVLIISFSGSVIAAVAIQRSLLTRRDWQSILRVTPREVFIFILLVFMTMVILQLMTTEWDELDFGNRRTIFWQRPEWLYPVIIVAVAAWCGSIANYITKRVGSATIVGLLALAFRLLLLNSFDLTGTSMGYQAYVLLLAPLVALDIGYALVLRRTGAPPNALLAGSAACAGLFAVSVPLIAQTMRYPAINAETLPGMVVMGLVLAAFFCWAGVSLVEWLGHFFPESETVDAQAQSAYAVWVPAGALIASVLFIVFFISTASPPIL